MNPDDEAWTGGGAHDALQKAGHVYAGATDSREGGRVHTYTHPEAGVTRVITSPSQAGGMGRVEAQLKQLQDQISSNRTSPAQKVQLRAQANQRG